jgi:hypothetical protein
MKITVTKEDIRKGQRGINNSCPIALALTRKEADRNPRKVLVLYTRAIVRFGEGVESTRETYSLSGSATRFVNAFDAGKKVKPQTFVLRALPGR